MLLAGTDAITRSRVRHTLDHEDRTVAPAGARLSGEHRVRSGYGSVVPHRSAEYAKRPRTGPKRGHARLGKRGSGAERRFSQTRRKAAPFGFPSHLSGRIGHKRTFWRNLDDLPSRRVSALEDCPASVVPRQSLRQATQTPARLARRVGRALARSARPPGGPQARLVGARLASGPGAGRALPPASRHRSDDQHRHSQAPSPRGRARPAAFGDCSGCAGRSAASQPGSQRSSSTKPDGPASRRSQACCEREQLANRGRSSNHCIAASAAERRRPILQGTRGSRCADRSDGTLGTRGVTGGRRSRSRPG